MDRSTAEWFEFLSRSLLWAGLVVLLLAIVGTIQIATSDSALPFFEQVQRESRGLAAIGTLAAGVTSAGILAGLGAILRLLLTLDTARLTEYEALRDALEKLRLNDPAFTYEPETSLALGYGFRCGFLGMLHMEIVQERLEREFDLSLIVTAPSVQYKVLTTAGEVLDIDNPSKLPSPDRIEQMDEPYVKSSVFVPTEFMTAIYKLAQEKRGEHRSLEYHGKRVHIRFDFPLAEIVVDFYDRLKSISKGYASFDYELSEFRPSDLVKLDILLNGDPVDALSIIVHRDKAYEKGKALVEKLRAVIPRQLFEVAIQAAIGSRVIARETVKAMGKNVTAKCYGGDITRKRKLLERQKEGKKRMKQVGKVEVPQEAFLSVLKS